MKFTTLLIFIFISLLVACGAAEPAPPQSILEDETLDLPLELDVQTTAAVQNRDDVILIDVREQWEYDEAHIPNVTLIPMSELANRLDEIPTDKEVILTCRSGNRSGQVTEFLQQNGFDNVHNMQGGILAWQQAGLKVEQ